MAARVMSLKYIFVICGKSWKAKAKSALFIQYAESDMCFVKTHSIKL